MQDKYGTLLAMRAVTVLFIFLIPAAAVVYYVKVHNPEASWLAFVSFIFSWIIFIPYYIFIVSKK